MSSRILKPTGDSRGAMASNRSRRIMKKPLIGSLSETAEHACVSRVASLADLAAPLAKDPRAAAFAHSGVAATRSALACCSFASISRQHPFRHAADRRPSPRHRSPPKTACLRCRPPPARAGRPGEAAHARIAAAMAFTARRCRRENCRRRKSPPRRCPPAAVQPPDQFGDIAAFLERRDDNGQQHARGLVGRGDGLCFDGRQRHGAIGSSEGRFGDRSRPSRQEPARRTPCRFASFPQKPILSICYFQLVEYEVLLFSYPTRWFMMIATSVRTSHLSNHKRGRDE